MKKLKMAIIVAVLALVLFALASDCNAKDTIKIGSGIMERQMNAQLIRFVKSSRSIVERILDEGAASKRDLSVLQGVLKKQVKLLRDNLNNVTETTSGRGTYVKVSTLYGPVYVSVSRNPRKKFNKKTRRYEYLPTSFEKNWYDLQEQKEIILKRIRLSESRNKLNRSLTNSK